MSTVKRVQRLHTMVWDFRRDTADVFPVPTERDSLRFAVTEVGEALDDFLRQNPTYKRNRDKGHTVERELTTCVMMLLTAIGPEYEFTPSPTGLVDIDTIVMWTAYCAFQHQRGERWQLTVVQTVSAICRYVGPEIEREMATLLDGMRAKHMGVNA